MEHAPFPTQSPHSEVIVQSNFNTSPKMMQVDNLGNGENKNKTRKTALIGGILIVFIFFTVVSIFVFWNNFASKPEAQPATNQDSDSTSQISSEFVEESTRSRFNSSVSTSETYISSEFGFSLKYPAGWIMEEGPELGAIVYFYSSDDEIYPANIYVTAVPAQGMSLEQYVSNNKKFNPDDEWSDFTGREYLSDTPVILEDGNKAVFFEGSMSVSGTETELQYILTKKDNLVYIVRANYLKTDKGLYEQMIKESLLSFQVL